MDFDEESTARINGFSPAARRLQLGLSAIVGRLDGTVVEIFPDGTEVVLSRRELAGNDPDRNLEDGSGGQGA